MMMRRPFGFIEPCQPSKVTKPPSGRLWVHEIKHNGYRLMVRRERTYHAMEDDERSPHIMPVQFS